MITLRVGFLEKVHENALVHELPKRALDVVRRCGVTVTSDGVVVEGSLIVELKVVEAVDDGDNTECLNYSEGDRAAFLPAVELWEVAAGNRADCSRQLRPLGISVCIRVHRWL